MRTTILNSNLETGAIRDRFERARRIQIEDALEPETAESLHQCLHKEVPWTLVFRDERGQPTELTTEQAKSLSPRQQSQHLRKIHQLAFTGGFQFLYGSYPMVPAYLEKRDPHLVLHRLLEYINAPDFLRQISAMTGVDKLEKADGQATRYVHGHFLTPHNDKGEGRRVAYVLNLSKGWRAEWGGLLHFLDEHGTIIDTYMPKFNSLVLFRVPIRHYVSYVAPYAGAPRYAITGWFREIT